MVSQKTNVELANDVNKLLDNIDPSGMTKEETAALMKSLRVFAQSTHELDELRKTDLEQIEKYRKDILKLDAENATSEAFITYKVLSDDYQRFKNKRLKYSTRIKKRRVYLGRVDPVERVRAPP